jgi:Uma2 family endonuclease
MESILEPILHSPLLPDYVEELTNYLRLENEKRLAFYEWLDEDTKAEFIDGEIIIHSPAREIHIMALDNMGEQVKAFVVKNNLGIVRKEQALVRMRRSDVMPDLLFFGNDKAVDIIANTKIYPIPEFVAEVLSPATEKNDRKKKFVEYALNGVKEYWIVDADKKKVEQYILFGSEYKLKKEYDEEEAIECVVLKNLTIEVSTIFNEKESQQAILKIIAG